VRLPDFDTVEEVEYEPPTLPAFFAPASLWVYQARWLEVTSVSGPRHFHDNKATIDCFNCDAVEAQANTPEGQPVIALEYTGWDRLRWGESEVRMVDDGGVVDRVETVTVNSKSYLRLWMDYGEVQVIQTGVTRPDYIDIPIDSATDSSVTQGSLTLNGTELDFGVGALEADSHTHTNKAVLDDLGAVYVVPNSAIKAATYETRPINGVRPTEVPTDGYSGAVYAGSPLTFQTTQTQSITITALTNNALYFYPEYVIEFTTGATAPTLTLPASVEWADELTVEANKHYQISIVNNIALWCAVDVEVEEEEE
ncbi:MAG: hypothetical protein IJU96_06290, partial [Clostridia bacterium]|nr:hypothetical protein [Clostridia bacterium]